jgi:hypothetical protein
MGHETYSSFSGEKEKKDADSLPEHPAKCMII